LVVVNHEQERAVCLERSANGAETDESELANPGQERVLVNVARQNPICQILTPYPARSYQGRMDCLLQEVVFTESLISVEERACHDAEVEQRQQVPVRGKGGNGLVAETAVIEEWNQLLGKGTLENLSLRPG
jgi:hypothetical protein